MNTHDIPRNTQIFDLAAIAAFIVGQTLTAFSADIPEILTTTAAGRLHADLAYGPGAREAERNAVLHAWFGKPNAKRVSRDSKVMRALFVSARERAEHASDAAAIAVARARAIECRAVIVTHDETIRTAWIEQCLATYAGAFAPDDATA